jgi:membrane protein DedA with SNARE-associated domain
MRTEPAAATPARHGPEAPRPEGPGQPLAPGQRLLSGRWGWLDVLIIGPILAQSVWYYAGIPLGQWLILHNHPIRAALLRGSTLAMVLSGAAVRTGGINLWVALLAPLPMTMATDPCVFFGGRRYGRALIDYLSRSDPRWARRMARGERIYGRFAGWAVFLAPVIWLPNAVFYFLAGETGMRFPRFILLDSAGELLFIAEMVALGYFIGRPAEDVVNALSRYSWWIIGGTLALAVALSTMNRLRRPGKGADLDRG